MNQPAYDHDFARICQWLRENGLIAKVDRKGNLTLYVKPKTDKNLPPPDTSLK